LVADDSVAAHRLTDLSTWRCEDDGTVDKECLEASMVLIDTAGCGLDELQVSVCVRALVGSRTGLSLVHPNPLVLNPRPGPP
jgi:hypothetical protein